VVSFSHNRRRNDDFADVAIFVLLGVDQSLALVVQALVLSADHRVFHGLEFVVLSVVWLTNIVIGVLIFENFAPIAHRSLRQIFGGASL
jgi:hypothetical protein